LRAVVAAREPEQLAPRELRRGDQHDRRLDAVATGFDRHRESVSRAAQHLAGRDDAGVEERDELGAHRGQRVGPRDDEILLRPRRQLGAEQHGLQDQELNEKADHGRRFYGSFAREPRDRDGKPHAIRVDVMRRGVTVRKDGIRSM
jgi:hypothetical protein